MTQDRLMRASEFWFRLLLRLYPKEFRDEMGTSVVETYGHRTRTILNRGRLSALAWLWLRAFADAIRNGLGERLHPAAAWRRPWLAENVVRDARHAFRVFRHNPGFTLVIILTLTLGIGAATAVFSVVD